MTNKKIVKLLSEISNHLEIEKNDIPYEHETSTKDDLNEIIFKLKRIETDLSVMIHKSEIND